MIEKPELSTKLREMRGSVGGSGFFDGGVVWGDKTVWCVLMILCLKNKQKMCIQDKINGILVLPYYYVVESIQELSGYWTEYCAVGQ